MKKYVLTLDLKDDPVLIAEYEDYHREIWPEIKASILRSGVVGMEIYRFGSRLCMLMYVGDDFSFEKKNESDVTDPRVQEWEDLMWTYQQALPGAKPGEKWVRMKKIFEL